MAEAITAITTKICLFAPLLLIGCATATPTWNSSTLAGFERTSYDTPDLYRGISVEMMSDQGVFLNVMTMTLPENRVSLENNGTTKFLYGKLFEGGQRLLLSPESASLLLEALKNGPATLRIGRFEQKLEPLISA